MNKPFQKIIDEPQYILRRTWGDNIIDIKGIIVETHEIYGNGITKKDFDAMIKKLTIGSQWNSILNSRSDPQIITSICTLYPNFITTKVIDNIIKYLRKDKYPQYCLESIKNTGYVFTTEQLNILSTAGYTILDILNTNVSYADLLTMFNSTDFSLTFKTNLNAKYSNNPALIDSKIQSLKSLCDKYNIIIEPDFINQIIYRLYKYSMISNENELLNLHIIASALGMRFEKQQFGKIVTNYSLDKINNETLKLIIDYYNDGESPIDRSFILNNLNHHTFSKFLHPTLTDYDPLEDIFYILFTIKQDEIPIYISHMLDHGYLIYDDFMMFLLYIRGENMLSSSINILEKYVAINCNQIKELTLSKNEIVKNNRARNLDYRYINQECIDLIYTFGNTKSIDFLSNNKIPITEEYLALCTLYGTFTELKKESFFLNDKTKQYIDKIIQSHVCSYTSCKVISDDDFVNMYNSLNKRDKQIAIRLPKNDIVDVSTIVRYDLSITRKMIEYKLIHDQWREIVSLLHLSKKYDYLIDFLDVETIMIAPCYISRNWFMNNLINNGTKSFAISNKIFDSRPHIDHDVDNLIQSSPIHDIDAMIESALLKEEITTREIITSMVVKENKL